MDDHLNGIVTGKKTMLPTNSYFNQAAQIYESTRPALEAMAKLTVQMQPLLQQAAKMQTQIVHLANYYDKQFRPVFVAFSKVAENDEVARKIRGEIATDIIILDSVIEELIMQRYVVKERQEEFDSNFGDEAFSTMLKLKILIRSGLLDKHDDLKKNLHTIVEIRNMVLHCKYRPTTTTVQILHKGNVKDVNTLNVEFKKLYDMCTKGLEQVSKEVNGQTKLV